MEKRIKYGLLWLLFLLTRLSAQSDQKVAYACEGMQASLQCPFGEVINVTEAKYGYFGENTCYQQQEHRNIICYDKSAKKHVSDVCDGLSYCKVMVTSTVFKNPCPTEIMKKATFVYTCIKAPIETAYADEGMKLTLKCSGNKKIIVVHGMYRKHPDIHNAQACDDSNITNYISQRCNGKECCNVIVYRDNLFNHCPELFKQAVIFFQCTTELAT